MNGLVDLSFNHLFVHNVKLKINRKEKGKRKEKEKQNSAQTPSLAQLGRPSRSPLPPLSPPPPARPTAPEFPRGPARCSAQLPASLAPRPTLAFPARAQPAPSPAPRRPSPSFPARARRPAQHARARAQPNSPGGRCSPARGAPAAAAPAGPARQDALFISYKPPDARLLRTPHDFFARRAVFFARRAVFFAREPGFSPSTAPPRLALALCVSCAVGVPPWSPCARSPHSLRSESRRRAAVEPTSLQPSCSPPR
jgi:hypothetical protein